MTEVPEVTAKSILPGAVPQPTDLGVPIPTPWGQLNVPQEIYDHYLSLDSQRTVDGQDVKTYLGFALQMMAFGGGTGTAVYFEHGMIVLRPDNRAFAVYGMIYLHYREFGDVQPTGWSPGLPTSDEEAAPGGRVSHFDAADIYWTSATGAHEVHGVIAAHLAALGGCGGWIGYPLTDESPVIHGGAQIGRMNNFENASIYWNQSTGAAEVHGDLRAAWLDAGGPSGSLGFPVSDETGSPSGACQYNDFQNGCLTWRAADGLVESYTALDVYVDRFTSQGVHTAGEASPVFASSIWLMVDSTITASTGETASPQFPGGGQNFGQPSASPQTQVLTIAPVRGSLVITASFTGYDHSPVQGNVNLGTVTGTFAIDQGWAINQPQESWDPSNSFFVAYSIRNDTPPDPGAPDYRQELYWSFQNTGTPVLSQQQFGQTFVDAEPNENWYQHPFNEAFYNLVYKGLAKSGRCYGMCLEANDALAGTSLYSEPLSSVNGDAAAWNEIDVKHGYQVGVNVINYVAGLFLAGQTHDPVRAFNDSSAMSVARNYPIISVTQEMIGGPGHAVRPYRWDTSDPADWKIYIANPNSPPSGGFSDDDPTNIIHVDSQSNTFSFEFGGPTDVWTGGTWTGGRMYVMPFSIACTEQHTPFWDVALILLGAAVLILGGDAQTSQISDDHGRTFYTPQAAGPPIRWSDITPDGPNVVPGMARLPLIAESQPGQPDALRATDAAVAADATSPGRIAREPGTTLQPGQAPPTSVAEPTELYWLQTGPPFGNVPVPIRTEPTGTPALTALAAAAPHAPAAAVDHGAAIVSDLPSQPPKPATRTVSEPVAVVVKPTPAPGLPDVITHDIAGTGTAGYQWGIRSGGGSVVATVPGQPGITDQLAVQRPGAADQSVTVTLDRGGPGRVLQFQLIGTSLDGSPAPKVFALSALTLSGGQAFTAQLTPDASGITLHNAGPEVTLDLEVSTGSPTVTASRAAVAIGTGEAVTITPTDWTPERLATAPMTVEVLASPGGPVVSERII